MSNLIDSQLKLFRERFHTLHKDGIIYSENNSIPISSKKGEGQLEAIESFLKSSMLLISEEVKKEIVDEIKIQSRWYMTDRNGKEYCSLCVEENYCSHEIKIEALEKVLGGK